MFFIVNNETCSEGNISDHENQLVNVNNLFE